MMAKATIETDTDIPALAPVEMERSDEGSRERGLSVGCEDEVVLGNVDKVGSLVGAGVVENLVSSEEDVGVGYDVPIVAISVMVCVSEGTKLAVPSPVVGLLAWPPLPVLSSISTPTALQPVMIFFLAFLWSSSLQELSRHDSALPGRFPVEQ